MRFLQRPHSTRRLLVAVLVAALGFWLIRMTSLSRLSREYDEIGRNHASLSKAYKKASTSLTPGPGSTKAELEEFHANLRRVSEHHARLEAKYVHASWHPWQTVKPDPKPPPCDVLILGCPP